MNDRSSTGYGFDPLSSISLIDGVADRAEADGAVRAQPDIERIRLSKDVVVESGIVDRGRRDRARVHELEAGSLESGPDGRHVYVRLLRFIAAQGEDDPEVGRWCPTAATQGGDRRAVRQVDRREHQEAFGEQPRCTRLVSVVTFFGGLRCEAGRGNRQETRLRLSECH